LQIGEESGLASIDRARIVNVGLDRVLDARSKLTQQGIVAGTLEDMSPEQVNDLAEIVTPYPAGNGNRSTRRPE
jgi:hypothetical protein